MRLYENLGLYSDLLYRAIESKPKEFIWTTRNLLKHTNENLPNKYKLLPGQLKFILRWQKKYKIFKRHPNRDTEYVFILK